MKPSAAAEALFRTKTAKKSHGKDKESSTSKVDGQSSKNDKALLELKEETDLKSGHVELEIQEKKLQQEKQELKKLEGKKEEPKDKKEDSTELDKRIKELEAKNNQKNKGKEQQPVDKNVTKKI